MFTGIIEDVGRVLERTPAGAEAKLCIGTALAGETALGDSVAVNGVCLTIEAKRPGALVFHVMHESLGRSNLELLAPGAEVNLERALRADGRLGGHLVSGHVDCLGRVLDVRRRAGDMALVLARPPAPDFLMVPKGSIAVDGVSLTVAELRGESFTVCIIPHTWSHTNLHLLKPGSPVNLEADVVGKFVRELQRPYPPKPDLDLDLLRNAGF